MNQFCIALLSDFDSEITQIKRKNSDSIIILNLTVDWLESKIEEMHRELKRYKFNTPHEEIQFFKELKPQLISKLIFYNKALELETNMPTYKKMKIKFFQKELEYIYQYTMKNKEFTEYYRSKASHKDNDYFIRNNSKRGNKDCYLINYDKKVCTSHDYKVATTIANDLLSEYLEDKIETVKYKTSLHPKSNLSWTASKVDLVELIYALQQSGSINGGSADVKEIAVNFGRILNIDIDEGIYRSYQDIKARKTVRTKFLNTITDNLNLKMNEEEY